MPLYIRRLQRADIPQVKQLDHEAFPTEWPPTNFPRELENKLAVYLVASTVPLSPVAVVAAGAKIPWWRRLAGLFLKGRENITTGEEKAPGDIVGYAGMWLLADEAHITSIATAGDYRRQGIGEALLIALIELAMQRNARVVTLEARVSNIAAQQLYLKYGFRQEGIRKGYYLDNHEDAVIMTTEYLGSPGFRETLAGLKKNRDARWGAASVDFDSARQY